MSDHDDHKPPSIAPDAPPTEEEVAASRRLREALEGASPDPAAELAADLALVASLRAAWTPDALGASAHAAILDDLPTAEELVLASELERALRGAPSTRGAAAGVELATALRAAWAPAALDPSEHHAIVARAVGASRAADVITLRARPHTARRFVVAATTALALAAGVVVWMTMNAPRESPLALARARSTQPLFGEPFKPGEASARIDRIASARSIDYRDNRFAKWGVR